MTSKNIAAALAARKRGSRSYKPPAREPKEKRPAAKKLVARKPAVSPGPLCAMKAFNSYQSQIPRVREGGSSVGICRICRKATLNPANRNQPWIS